MLRLGYHPATWGRRLEGVQAGIAWMASCGWDGFEYAGDLDAECRGCADEFRTLLQKHEMALSAVYLSCGFVDEEEIARWLERVRRNARFCADVGCQFLLIDGGQRHPDNVYSEEDFRRVSDAANRAGEICRQAGIRCSWHQHFGTMFEFQENFDRLMALTDPDLVLCTPDTAQHALGDFDVVPAVRRYAHRIQYIHFKDLDRKRRFIELGRGTIDFWGCWQALQQAGFSGWIVVDLDYTSLSPEESCRLNKLYLNEILGIRGERDRRRTAD